MTNLRRNNPEFQETKAVKAKHKAAAKVNSLGFKEQRNRMIRQFLSSEMPNWGGIRFEVA